MSSAKTPLELLQAAAERHGAGDFPAAELLYRAALHREPHPVGQHLLGALLHVTGRHEEAIRYLEQAAAQLPNDVELLGNYGAALVAANRHAEAIAALDRAMAAAPTPSAPLLVNRSAAYRALGEFDSALADANQALALTSDLPGAFSNAGSALQSLGRPHEALAVLLQGLERHPDEATLQTNVGVTLFMLGQPHAAKAHLERAVEIDPDIAEAQASLGATLQELGDFIGADACYQRALAIDPGHLGALSNLGGLDLSRGRPDVALARFEAALRIDPIHREAASNSLLALNYLPALAPDAIADLHRDWGARLPTPAAAPRFLPAGEPRRIGFLSPDLWNHPVASFLEPLLNAVDRSRYHLHVYNDRARGDATTDRLRSLGTDWVDVAGWRGRDVVQKIRDDRIDILVELAGHTAGNRLLDLAARAAPVQISMIGYPNTTGLPSMDFRVTDAIADPIGAADGQHSEKLLRLPGGFLCWRPPDDAPEPRASGDRPITFGSFNALAKLSVTTIAAWAATLTAVPESRLVLKSKALADPETRNRILRAFSAHRIAADRLTLLAWLPATQDHLGFYSEIDVALDPFPYNGTTTTMEALWMGVPVVSLIGESHAGRVGASILLHAGLAEDLAADIVAYVGRAIDLARAPDVLARRRAEMRDRLRASSLLDGRRYARVMEQAWETALASIG